jgi:hypothetical protein
MFAGQLHLALADAVEQRFQDVGDFGDVGEAEGGGAPLDGVRGAEDRVEVFAVRRRNASSSSASSKKTW